jgi:hypothetical protein
MIFFIISLSTVVLCLEGGCNDRDVVTLPNHYAVRLPVTPPRTPFSFLYLLLFYLTSWGTVLLLSLLREYVYIPAQMYQLSRTNPKLLNCQLLRFKSFTCVSNLISLLPSVTKITFVTSFWQNPCFLKKSVDSCCGPILDWSSDISLSSRQPACFWYPHDFQVPYQYPR